MFLGLLIVIHHGLLQIVEPTGAGCRTSSDHGYHGTHSNCSHLNLKEIPQNFSRNISSIDLGFNILETVRNDSFVYLKHLRHLDLNDNRITKLETLAFHGCNELRHLDLSSNQLTLTYKSYPSTVFDNLVHLQWLNIKGNKQGKDGEYPERIFKNLSNLKVLCTDAFGEPVFTQEFQHLQNLRELDFGGLQCGLNIIRNHTFLAFSSTHLEVLVLTLCPVSTLEPGAFASLTKLKELYMDDVGGHGIRIILTSLSAFAGQTMKLISLIGVHLNVHSSARLQIEDVILDEGDLRYLSEICIERIMLRRCKLLYINIWSLANTNFSRCLRYLDLSGNKFFGDFKSHYITLQTFTNLKYLDISHQLGSYLPSSMSNLISGKPDQRTIPESTNEEFLETLTTVSNLESQLRLLWPRSLQYINASAVSHTVGSVLMNVTIKNGDVLLEANLSFMGLTDLTGQIEGLENIRVLDLSGNPHLRLSDSFFDTLSSLEVLHMSHMSFQQNSLLMQGKRLFKSLFRLRSLHLKGNRLSQFPAKVFEDNPLLECLDLSTNIFSSIPFDILLTPYLQMLDMTSNSLGYLATSTQINFDKQAATLQGKFHLLLSGNLLSCGCERFKFLVWLQETKTIIDNKTSLHCLLDSGDISNNFVSLKQLDKLGKKCIGRSLLYVTLSTFIILLCGFLLGLLVKTNYSTLMYAILNLLRRQFPKPMRGDFERDVYVSYADGDYRWVCHYLCPALEARKLNLFIWDRDSLPGDSTPDQIVENIETSRKILLFFTASYEIERWTYMSMMTAISCVNDFDPRRLILLLPKDEHPFIPYCLLNVVPESCILRVPAHVGRLNAVRNGSAPDNLLWNDPAVDAEILNDPFWNNLTRIIQK